MLLVLDLTWCWRHLATVTGDVVVEIFFVVDFDDQLAQTLLRRRRIAFGQRTHSQTVSKKKLLVEGSILLQLQGKSLIALFDQRLQCFDSLRSSNPYEVVTLSPRLLHLFFVLAVGGLNLMQHFGLNLFGALRSLQAQPPAALGIARPGAIVAFSQSIVASLRLLHSLLRIKRFLLSIQALVLLLLPSPFDLRSQSVEILVHLVQRKRKLHPVVTHALVHAQQLAQLQCIAPALGVWPTSGIHLSLRKALQPFCLLLFQPGAFTKEVGKVTRRCDALLEAVQEGVDADVRVHDIVDGFGRALGRIVGDYR